MRNNSRNPTAELLDRAVPEEFLRESTRHFARPARDNAQHSNAAIVFRLGSEWLALPISVLDEVAEHRAIHSLPHRGNDIAFGLTNIRGELVICVSLYRMLGIEMEAESQQARQRRMQRLLVIRREGSRLVFLVDEVQGIHHFDELELQTVPATITSATASYTKAMLALDDGKSAGFLDDELLFYTLNRSLL